MSPPFFFPLFNLRPLYLSIPPLLSIDDLLTSAASMTSLSTSPNALNLMSFPEELLERILAHCVLCSSDLPPFRPSWHQKAAATTISVSPFPTLDEVHDQQIYAGKGRASPLFVNRLFRRIATPLFYHTVHVTSRRQASSLHYAFSGNPSLALHVRRISVSGVWTQMSDVLRHCDGVQALDIALCGDDGGSGTSSPGETGPDAGAHINPLPDPDAQEFGDALDSLKHVRHIALRKMHSVYLTHSRPRYLIKRVALAMHRWDQLETAHVAFRISDDTLPTAHPVSTPAGELPSEVPMELLLGLPPIAALTAALRTRPRLHTFSTLLPSVWNNTILTVSQNQSLQRIVLGDGAENSTSAGSSRPIIANGHPVPSGTCTDTGYLGTGLFLMEVRKHPRLVDLITAGTPFLNSRTRAHTHV